MRAILINSADETVTETELSEDAQSAFEEIRHLCNCQWLQTVQLHEGVFAWVDEEGLLKSPTPDKFFRIGLPENQIMAGNAVITGIEDDDIASLPDDITLDLIKHQVEFPNVKFSGIEQVNDTVDHPIFGRIGRVTRKAKFEPLS